MAVNIEALLKKTQGESQVIRQASGGQAAPAPVRTTSPKTGFLSKVKSFAERAWKWAVPKEKTEFFSGTLGHKAYDISQIPEYAYAGVQRRAQEIKEGVKEKPPDFLGKLGSLWEGAKEGIKYRREFGMRPQDVNLGQTLGIKDPLKQQAYNLGLALAIPALPLGKLTKYGGKALGVIPGMAAAGRKIKGLGKTITSFAKETPSIYKKIEQVAPFFRKPEFGKMLQKSEEATGFRLNKLYKIVKDASEGLSKTARKTVGELIEAGPEARKGQGVLGDIAGSISDMADDVGREAVKLGKMTEETFQNFKGKYMTHIWDDIVKGKQDMLKLSDIPDYSGRFFQKRKGKAGYIQEFAAPVFKGLGTEIKDIEAVKFYKNVAKKFGVKTDSPEKMVELAQKGYDFFRGKQSSLNDAFKKTMFPPEVIDYIKRVKQIPAENAILDGFNKLQDTWKKGKTLWNPAYHPRNILSNIILAGMSTGKGVFNTSLDYLRAVRNYAGKGNQKFADAAEAVGLIKAKTFAKRFNEFLDVGELADAGKLKKIDEFSRAFQNVTEETAKLSVFRHWIGEFADEAGMAISKALKDPDILRKASDKAQEAIFSPYKISKSERSLMKYVFPFYSFTRQALPFTAKTYLEHPKRITKYKRFGHAVEGLTGEDYIPEEKRPEWMDEAVQLPTKVKGEPVALDPSYVYPWGSFGEFKTGPFGLGPNPLISEWYEQKLNKDLYFGKEIAKSQIPKKALGQRLEHLATTFLPSVYRTGKGKLYPAFKGVPDYMGRDRSKAMAIIDALGIKTSVLRPEEEAKFRRWDKRTQLKEIDSEKRSIMKDARIPADKKRTLIKELNHVRSVVLKEK